MEIMNLSYFSRCLVMFFKKFNISFKILPKKFKNSLQDLYHSEYKYKKIIDKEVSHLEKNFLFSLTLDFSYKDINLNLTDLTWFLTRNRYLINKYCRNQWYYYNQCYYFSSFDECRLMRQKFLKYGYKILNGEKQ